MRTGRHFDGWFPLGPDAPTIAERWKAVQTSAAEAGRNASDVTCAIYLTLAINDDAAAAERQVDGFLEEYYSVPAAAMKRVQAATPGRRRREGVAAGVHRRRRVPRGAALRR